MGMIYLQLAVLGPRGGTELNADISACARLQMAFSGKQPPATFSRDRCLTDHLGLKAHPGYVPGPAGSVGLVDLPASLATGATLVALGPDRCHEMAGSECAEHPHLLPAHLLPAHLLLAYLLHAHLLHAYHLPVHIFPAHLLSAHPLHARIHHAHLVPFVLLILCTLVSRERRALSVALGSPLWTGIITAFWPCCCCPCCCTLYLNTANI